MRILLQIISYIALAGTILPSMLYFGETLNLDQTKWLMLLAAVVWFAVTPLWMNRKEAGVTSNMNDPQDSSPYASRRTGS